MLGGCYREVHSRQRRVTCREDTIMWARIWDWHQTRSWKLGYRHGKEGRPCDSPWWADEGVASLPTCKGWISISRRWPQRTNLRLQSTYLIFEDVSTLTCVRGGNSIQLRLTCCSGFAMGGFQKHGTMGLRSTGRIPANLDTRFAHN